VEPKASGQTRELQIHRENVVPIVALQYFGRSEPHEVVYSRCREQSCSTSAERVHQEVLGGEAALCEPVAHLVQQSSSYRRAKTHPARRVFGVAELFENERELLGEHDVVREVGGLVGAAVGCVGTEKALRLDVEIHVLER